MSQWLNKFSMQGYKSNSPDKDNPYNVIPSGRITMKDVPHPVLGIDNFGNKQFMMPGGEYQFPGQSVFEVPIKSDNMKLMKNGGAAAGHAGKFWDGEKWVSSSDGATYNNGVFYAMGGKYSQNGGPTFPMGGAGPLFAHGGPTATFYVDGNGYPTPFAMAPGSGQGSGYLQDLPTHMRMGGNTASFYVDGNGRPEPFAMWPGSGTGSGMLQDLPETMKKGGKPHGKPKMSPAQMQMMMAAMGQGQGMPPGGAPPMGMPMGQPMGQMMPQPGMMPQAPQGPPAQDAMKKGGHWIQKAVNPAHKGYCTPMTKSTCTPRRKALARTFKKHHGFHHEYGGPAMMQNGGLPPGSSPYNFQYGPYERLFGAGVSYPGDTLTDNQLEALAHSNRMQTMNGVVMMKGPNGQHYSYELSNKDISKFPNIKDTRSMWGKFTGSGEDATYLPAPITPKKQMGGKFAHGGPCMECGGMAIGPYHPLQWLQDGGLTGNDPMGGAGAMNLPADPNQPNPWQPDKSNYDPSTDPNNPVNQPQNQPMYTADQSQNSPSPDQQQPQMDGPVNHQWNGWNKFSRGVNTGMATLGTGLAVASMYNNLRDQRDNAAYMRSLGTSDHIAKMNQPGGKGDWDQYGAFRPNQNTPVRPGLYYPGQTGFAAYGGSYSQNGGYHPGQELELSDADIARMKKMGYQFQDL